LPIRTWWCHGVTRKIRSSLEQKTGYKITYRKLASGADVIRALASGAVQIGEAGSAPIASGLSQGLDIQLFWILDNINDAEALVARNGSGVKSLADLNGKRVAVPFVSTSHFHTLLALEHAGIDPRSVKVVNMRPPEIAAAWERGDIDATFIWDPVLARVKKSGRVLTTSGQIAQQTGKATFDGIVVSKSFAAQHDVFLTELVKVLAASDDNYRRNKAAWKRRFGAGEVGGETVRRGSRRSAGKSGAVRIPDTGAASVASVAGRRCGKVAGGHRSVPENSGHDSTSPAGLFRGSKCRMVRKAAAH